MFNFAAVLLFNNKVRIMDAIIGYIIEKWPVLLLVIITGFVVWLVTRWYFCHFAKVEEKADKMDKLPCTKNEELLSGIAARLEEKSNKIDNLPCGKHDELYRELKEELAANRAFFAKLEEKSNKIDSLPCSKHEDVFNDIRDELMAISTFLTIKYPAAAPVFSKKKSPRELNDAGKQLFDDIDGGKFLDENGGFLIECIEKKTPKTALDAEEASLQVLYDNMDADMFIAMKNWVYNSPSRKIIIDGNEKDYVITMNDVCFVLSLPLRNRYLDTHPELRQF